jgi:hypothetical protein
MTPSSNGRVLLIDSADGPGRTTATLVASLTARLATLHMVSGADAVGSLTAGFVALGREVSQSAEGARVRKAIERGRASANGNALWSALRISEWVSGLPASPVLQHLRNDLALLLADDLQDTLEVLPIPSQPAGAQVPESSESATFLDCVVGMWAFSMELVRSVEALAGPTLSPGGFVAAADGPSPEAESTLLR